MKIKDTTKKDCDICSKPIPKKIGCIVYPKNKWVCLREDCVDKYKNSLSTGARL